MNKLLKRLPLTVKLILIGLLPLIILIILAFQVFGEKNEKIAMIDGYLKRTQQSAKISKVVSELQRERRYSFGFVLKKEWSTEMRLQRAATDTSLEGLSDHLDERLKDFSKYTFLEELPATRLAIDNGTISPDRVLSFYTNTIFRLNTFNSVAAGNVVYLQSANDDLVAQKLLQEMITYLGIIRANIYYALSSGNTAAASPASLNAVYKIFNSYRNELFAKAPPAVIQRYQKLADSAQVRTTLEFMRSLSVSDSALNTYEAENWWTTSAIAVNKLQEFQKQLLNAAEQKVTTIYRNEVTSRNITLVVMILIIAAVILLTAYVARVISAMMNELKYAAQRIAIGATGIHIEISSNDAIGSLAKSIYKIDQNNKVLSEAAEAIGQGNLDITVTPRSEEDMLGNAIKKMKHELRQFRKENNDKLWMHAGLEQVNNAMQGEKELSQLAADTLHAILGYIDAELGLFYIAEDHLLTYSAGYAVTSEEMIPKKIRFGETLLGEAAVKQQIMQFDVPDEFIRVSSGSGTAMPRHILLLPLVHNHIVEGVIEMASFKEFEPRALFFLKEIQSTAALILRTAKNRVRLQELLEETQSQAEELQAQHAELENINAELEAQAQKLQVSEEELKVQQEELMQANQELEERTRLLEERNLMIAEQNSEIRKKAEELALSTKYKSEFLANMSHELRTPLNSILLLSRLLSENMEKNLTPEQVEYARVIMSSGNGLLNLIDEILDLSKIEAGKMQLEFAGTSLSEVASELQALFTPLANDKNIGFEIELGPHLPPTIETDRLRLEQVLKNLVSNAIKFTAQGSVKLTVSTLPDQPAFISFSVKDTGIGIPRDKQLLIFEAFQQADGSTRRKYGGTGLGLSISRELVKLLGGEIKLTSEPGQGSEFTVYLPKKKPVVEPEIKPAEALLREALEAPAPQAELTEAGEEETSRQTREKYISTRIPESIPDDRQSITPADKAILIIEDDVAFARALLDFTRSKGYKGLVAVRGDEGTELAMQFKPVGILLDLELPVKDGWEVMDELKKNKNTRHIPVHMMSSYEVKKESLYKGAVDFINKPVAYDQMQEIFQKIEKVVAEEKKKVLIVEENPRHARALAYYLETNDINAEITTDYQAGVSALKKENVNCVIMDMGIPGQQGYEMLEAVKKESGLEHLPIIIFTGKSLSKTEESRIRQYADTIVVKTAHSYKRILDEVSIFLHLMEENRRKEQARGSSRSLGGLQEVLSNKKVLVVDDDVRNIFSLSRALETNGMKVVSAVDGTEALAQLEKDPAVDAVLMDIMMPEMDGYETMKRIRKMKRFKHLPIIAVTAKAMTGDREKCIQAGASDYISKPVDVDQLLSLLRVWLYDKAG